MIAITGFMISIKKNITEEKEPINELNINIVKLTESIDAMKERDVVRDRRITKHGEEIDKIKDDLAERGKVLSNHEYRIQSLEKWRAKEDD